MTNKSMTSSLLSDKFISYFLLAIAATCFIAFGLINRSEAASMEGKVVSLKGEVTQVKPNHLTVKYEGTLSNGTRTLVHRTFKTSDADLPGHTLVPGSQVKVWFWYGTNNATRVKDRAPDDLIKVYGAVDGER